MDFEQRAPRIVRPVQEELELQSIDVMRQLLQTGRHFACRRLVLLLTGELGQNRKIVAAILRRGDRLEPAFYLAKAPVDPRRFLAILPEIASALELFESLLLLVQSRHVKDPP
jgi:hypothetical protein